MLEIARRTRFSSRPQLGAISSSRCQTTRMPVLPHNMRNLVYFRTSRWMVSADDPASGGARRDRTDDLLLAKQALSQLSYGPLFSGTLKVGAKAGLPSRSSRAASPPSPFRASARQPSPRLRERRLVGLGRFELPTSRLSSARSNQLSYKPLPAISDQMSATVGDTRLIAEH
jgi:hypothetical protein